MKAEKIANVLKRKYKINNVDWAIVVGSGLADSVPELENPVIVSYDSLKMPKSKVKGHSGKFIFGTYKNKKVAIVSRIHFYESGDMTKVRLPFEILSHLGLKNMILLTSSGGLNKGFKVGDIMLIHDQINFTGFNPLIGIEKLEFTSMTNCYDHDLFEQMEQIAKQNDVDVRKGIHVQMSGPSYETKAEVSVARGFGADTVSMSTAFDCIICNYLGMRVAGISSVVNVFDDKEEKLTHDEVLDNARKACRKIKTILENLIK